MATPRVTLRSIAGVLNLHHSTVSRALKNDRRIPPETRERVLKATRELGYQPDPMLSALMTYRKSRATRERYRATLGWITNYPTKDGWREYEKNAYFRGATRRAHELGYMLEEFWLAEPGLTQKRAIQILEARNIHGLFLSRLRDRAHTCCLTGAGLRRSRSAVLWRGRFSTMWTMTISVRWPCSCASSGDWATSGRDSPAGRASTSRTTVHGRRLSGPTKVCRRENRFRFSCISLGLERRSGSGFLSANPMWS